jgi:tetratricopeptide (TPR) repeat protein
MLRLFAMPLIALVFAPFLQAQPGTKDNCDLSVRVRTIDERSIETPIKVEVLTSEGVLATNNVLGGDLAHFKVTSGRNYRLQVSGTGLETVMTPFFEINGLEQEHSETILVRLKSEKNDGETAQGETTISVSEMDIPKKAGAEMKRGLEEYSKGDMVKAEADFEKAAADYPHYARADEMLGVIAIKRGDRIKAREFFTNSIQMDATFVPAYLDLARIDLQDQQYAASESLLVKAVSLNPSMPDAVALLATTEFADKDYDKAIADVERTHALRNHEQFAEVHVMAGKVLRMQGHPAEALAQFQLFLKEKPESPEAASVRNAVTALEAEQHP